MGMAWQIGDFRLIETRKVLFGHGVNDSFVVGKGIDLDSFSFNPVNFCSSSERSLQQKVKKISQEWSCEFHDLHKFLLAKLEKFAFFSEKDHFC